MSALPTRFAQVILCFARLFRQRTWRCAEQLLIGAILAPKARTVASVLRVLGHSRERHFVNYHRVLSRAAWSPRAAARVLLRLLVKAFVPRGPVVLGIDDTIDASSRRSPQHAASRCGSCGSCATTISPASTAGCPKRAPMRYRTCSDSPPGSKPIFRPCEPPSARPGAVVRSKARSTG